MATCQYCRLAQGDLVLGVGRDVAQHAGHLPHVRPGSQAGPPSGRAVSEDDARMCVHPQALGEQPRDQTGARQTAGAPRRPGKIIT